ncbi:MAG: aspartate kinase [Pseudomonadota bacterium]
MTTLKRTIKFGGTSMGSAQCIKRCAGIVRNGLDEHQIVVVVSAVGGVTRQLIEIVEFAKNQKPRLVSAKLNEIEEKYKKIVDELVPMRARELWREDFNPRFEKLRAILHGTSLVGDVSDKTYALILSYGERLSSFLMCYALEEIHIPCKRISAKKLVRTDSQYLEANVNFAATRIAFRNTIKPLLAKNITPVITGFIGKDTHGDVTLLGIGGSDYTAAITALSLDANAIDIWTDADGIMSADPRIVDKAFSWPTLDIHVASEMAFGGAKVVHPKSIIAAIRKNIPVHVLNTFNPEFKGTVISAEKSEGIKGVVINLNNTLINLENPAILGGVGFIAKVGEVLSDQQVPCDVCATSETSFTFSIRSQDYSKRLYEALSKVARVEVFEKIAKLSVIGTKVARDNKLISEIFDTLHQEKITSYTLSMGASANNITVMIDNHQALDALRMLHDKLIIKGSEK